MQVTKNITLDLLETGSPVIIKAKQNDRNTRYIAAHLYVDGLAYPVPSGTEIAFRYKKPDGTAGFYDALPNNSPAITVSGNTVTVELVEQVLTVAGCVHCEINMYNAASEKLTTFTFEISVEESVLTDAEIISSDYYNVLTAEIAKALQAVTDATEQAENAAQSAQDAADNAAMSKDWAAGQPVTYNGTPVSIAYAGAQRIASITAYGENAQGGTTEAPVALTGISSITVNDDVTELPIPRPLRRVGDVRDVCRTRVKSVYDKRIVLDGTEDWKMGSAVGDGAPYIVCGLLNDHYQSDPIVSSRIPYTSISASNKNQGIGCWDRSLYLRYDSLFTNVEELKTYLSAHPLTVYYQSTAYDGTNGLDVCLTEYQTDYIESYADESITTAWISSTGALSTGAEVAYVLSSPETYATDPLDIDNAAGPLTVLTGGAVEVRMTELIGTRSDVSNNTVAFSEASQDADIQTGEKLSVLFGKIKKRLSLLQAKADNSLQTTVKTVIGAINEVLGRTKATKTTLNASDALSPTGNGIAYVYTQGDMKTLLAEMSSLGNFDAGRTLFVFAGDLRPSSMICFTGFIDRAPKTFFIYPNGELKTLETSINLNQTLVLNVTYK
ncbi:BppU family phage baseplate upper protein [Ruthenibacterium lactatiformans]|uniref:BppU family phage baseplate upper protein n=1 Tax=Ruthenibacterium lactatiformans TaxID=1550024 RepID=UPI001967E4F4|nr:BppU family phage baseplate upper protein [Ruthenibacterium lactatiformans]MBN2995857.1 BppU family phage baseplate upper protein [Ruthenibacterium lactatiformans]